MKKFPIFLTLLCTIAWFYGCWYWYTCHIKDFCLGTEQTSLDQDTSGSGAQEEEIPFSPGQEILSIEEVSTGTLSQVSDTQSGTTQSGASLEAPELSSNASLMKVSCDDIITKAISLGGNNDEVEVKSLETFLNTQGETLDVDGRYSQEDFEAVKRFQLQYKADILDPAGIANPTGYVYNNTIKKINQVHCQ